MKVVIAGGSGFLGGALTTALRARGDDVVVLSRRQVAQGFSPAAAGFSPAVASVSPSVRWEPNGASGPWARELDGADAVINLAGEPLADKRWTADQKRRIVDSRVLATRSLAAAIHGAARPPRVMISASGVGFYPDSDRIVDESSPPGTGFLAQVCERWEREARAAESPHTRVVLLRTGVVLHRDGGALRKLLLPFKLGAGGPIGTGRQWWAWIHRADWVRMTLWAIDRDGVTGPLNACAPEPAQNREIARALGRALHRPSFMPAPAFALRLMLGEMADEMLLASQRAIAHAARQLGFSWTYADLDAAMRAAIRD